MSAGRWTAVGRLVGMATVAFLMAVISAANRNPHHPAVHFCCGYTPARLVAGAWWTVPGSALLVVNLRPFGSDTLLLLGVVLPFVLREGFRKVAAAFFTGHVLATVAVAAVVLPLAAWGWHPAEATRIRVDVGSSAGVAAVAGALAVSLRRARPAVPLDRGPGGRPGRAATGLSGRGVARRRNRGEAWLRRWGPELLVGAFALDFVVRLVLFHTLAEIEHLIALAAGVLLGRWWERRRGAGLPVSVSSPVHGHPGTLAGVDGTRRSR